MTVVRWLLVPVSALAAWGASLFLGTVLLDGATRLCPDAEMVSGLCIAPWWRYAETGVICLSAAVAAALIVVASSLTAPSHRSVVAVVVFVLGCAFAVFLAVAGGTYIALPAAGIAGGLAVRWIRRPYIA
jgi:hypothetical protein